jgi:hypothetical protein
MTWILGITVVAFLAGIILLGAKSPLKRLTREEFLQELTKFLEGAIELIGNEKEDGRSFRIRFKFKGQEFLYEDLESQGFKNKVYRGYLKVKTPSKLTLTFTEKERSTRIRSDIFMASEVSAHYIDAHAFLQVPECLKDLKASTNDTMEANRILEDKKIVSILRKYANIDTRGYHYLSLGIIDGVVILEFSSEKTNKPNISAIRENIPSIDDYLEELVVFFKKLKEKT